MSTAEKVFEGTFGRIEKVIQFNINWKNGTGYLNGAVSGNIAPKLEPGEMVKCIDDLDRKVIILGTRLGNVVVFERYKRAPENRTVYVFNTTKEINSLRYFLETRLNHSDMLMLFGSWFNFEENFGFHLEEAAKQFGSKNQALSFIRKMASKV